MAKSKKILYACDVFAARDVELNWKNLKGPKLVLAPVKDCGVLIVPRPGYVHQKIIELIREQIVHKSFRTYIPSGQILVPIFKPVPNWEIDYYKEQKINLISLGIKMLDGKYMRLCFMRLEDIAHAVRQQFHIMGNYHPEVILQKTTSIEAYTEALFRAEFISSKIVTRKNALQRLEEFTKIRMRELRSMLQNISDYSPIFNPKLNWDGSRATVHTVSNIFENTAQTCRAFRMRPVGIRLQRSARSLEKAIENLHKNRVDLARVNLKSAISNLAYPKDEG